MEDNKSPSNVKNLVVVAFIAVLFTFVGIIIASSLNLSPPSHSVTSKEESREQTAKEGLLSGSESPFVTVAEKVKPAVVNITAKRVVKVKFPRFFDFFEFEGPFEEFFKEFRSPEKEREFKQPILGSGFIMDREGYVLTNNHVIAGAKGITVRLSDKREFKAEIVGQDPETDVALIKLETDEDIPSDEIAQLGDSDAIKVGDWAIAIGNPFGLDRTVTVGVISAKGRSGLTIEGGTPSFQDFIQTDAAINFGNSGGPLVNIKGEVIGINTAIKGRAQGIGFAIPINMARKIMPQLKEKGKVVRGALGITVQELTQGMAEAKGLPSTEGALVADVRRDTPAEKGGLKTGDVIVEFEGEKIKTVNQFVTLVAEHSPGEKVKMTIIRDGEEKSLAFTLGDRAEIFGLEVVARKGEEEAWMGMEVADVRSDVARSMRIKEKKGVVVTDVEPGSPADDEGIEPGDVILQIGDQKIEDLDDYQRVAEELKDSEKPVMFLTRHGQSTRWVALKEK